MLVPFDLLPPSSRIWIYQADRKISAVERDFITSYLQDYCDQWSAHGQPLRSSFKLHDDFFVILAVDESVHGASGCSIDTSVNAIKSITQKTGIDFFNRELIAFKHDHIELVPFKFLKEKFSNGILNASTPAFNNTITVKADLETQWLKPAVDTWLKRYIPSGAVKLD